jgi:LmbE family N-acetylglucosaminyl deacetylase
VPRGGDLLVVAPHPDDEVLGVGGILASFPRARLVAVTDGEGSHAPSVVGAADLAVRRSLERSRALEALGLPGLSVARLAQPDGEVDCDLLANQLTPLLRAGDTCLATWRHDGHPDHEAVGRAAAEACRRVGARLWEYPIWMWHWAGPDDDRVPWQRARRFPLTPVLAARKATAIAQFDSQIAPLSADPSGEPVLGPNVLARFHRPDEVVFVQPG